MSAPPPPPGGDGPLGGPPPRFGPAAGDGPGSGSQPGGAHPTGQYPAGPYPAGPYPAGPYPAGPYPAGPYAASTPPAPPGYAVYGQPTGAPTAFSGMAIAGFVLALAGLVPCFWIWLQLPGVLGVVFSLVGLSQTRAGAKRGRGLAIAGLVVGVITILITIGFTAFVYTSDECVTDGLEIDCRFDS